MKSEHTYHRLKDLKHTSGYLLKFSAGRAPLHHRDVISAAIFAPSHYGHSGTWSHNFSPTLPHFREQIRSIKKFGREPYFKKILTHNVFTKCTCLLTPFSCLLSLVSCLLNYVYCLTSPDSCLLSPVSRLTSHVS